MQKMQVYFKNGSLKFMVMMQKMQVCFKNGLQSLKRDNFSLKTNNTVEDLKIWKTGELMEVLKTQDKQQINLSKN